MVDTFAGIFNACMASDISVYGGIGAHGGEADQPGNQQALIY
jgi:hypothetical protein